MVSTAEKNIKQTKKFFFDILNYNFLKPIIAKRTTFPFQIKILSHNYKKPEKQRIFLPNCRTFWWDWRTNLAKTWQQWSPGKKGQENTYVVHLLTDQLLRRSIATAQKH
jgi:hypothetical protein